MCTFFSKDAPDPTDLTSKVSGEAAGGWSSPLGRRRSTSGGSSPPSGGAAGGRRSTFFPFGRSRKRGVSEEAQAGGPSAVAVPDGAGGVGGAALAYRAQCPHCMQAVRVAGSALTPAADGAAPSFRCSNCGSVFSVALAGREQTDATGHHSPSALAAAGGRPLASASLDSIPSSDSRASLHAGGHF